MTVTVDRRQMWFCRDCGAPIADDKTVARLDERLGASSRHETKLDDAGRAAFHLTMPRACGSCGGGRVVLRTGKFG